jgi:hypothetical protein
MGIEWNMKRKEKDIRCLLFWGVVVRMGRYEITFSAESDCRIRWQSPRNAYSTPPPPTRFLLFAKSLTQPLA